MNIKPIRDFVAIVKEDSQKRTASGIYVPDNVESRVATGRVVAVGSGHVNERGSVTPLEISNGDKVVFHHHSSTDVTVDGKTYLLVRENQIICKVND